MKLIITCACLLALATIVLSADSSDGNNSTTAVPSNTTTASAALNSTTASAALNSTTARAALNSTTARAALNLTTEPRNKTSAGNNNATKTIAGAKTNIGIAKKTSKVEDTPAKIGTVQSKAVQSGAANSTSPHNTDINGNVKSIGNVNGNGLGNINGTGNGNVTKI